MKTPEGTPEFVREFWEAHDRFDRLPWYQQVAIGRIVALCRLLVGQTHDASEVVAESAKADPQVVDALDCLKEEQ